MVCRRFSVFSILIISLYFARKGFIYKKAVDIQSQYADYLSQTCTDLPNLNIDDQIDDWQDGCYSFVAKINVDGEISTGDFLPETMKCTNNGFRMRQDVWQWQEYVYSYDTADIKKGWKNIDSEDWRVRKDYNPDTFLFPSTNVSTHGTKYINMPRENIYFGNGQTKIYFDGFQNMLPAWANKFKSFSSSQIEEIISDAYERQMRIISNYLGDDPIQNAPGTFYSDTSAEDIRLNQDTNLDNDYNTGFPFCMTAEAANEWLEASSNNNFAITADQWENTPSYGDLTAYPPCWLDDEDFEVNSYKFQGACEGSKPNEKVRVVAQVNKVTDENGNAILVAGFLEDHETFPHSFKTKPILSTSNFAINHRDVDMVSALLTYDKEKNQLITIGDKKVLYEDHLVAQVNHKKKVYFILAIVFFIIGAIGFAVFFINFDTGKVAIAEGKWMNHPFRKNKANL